MQLKPPATHLLVSLAGRDVVRGSGGKRGWDGTGSKPPADGGFRDPHCLRYFADWGSRSTPTGMDQSKPAEHGPPSGSH